MSYLHVLVVLCTIHSDSLSISLYIHRSTLFLSLYVRNEHFHGLVELQNITILFCPTALTTQIRYMNSLFHITCNIFVNSNSFISTRIFSGFFCHFLFVSSIFCCLSLYAFNYYFLQKYSFINSMWYIHNDVRSL